jgi:uncharacterized protein YunC (DUF1805 family)
MVSIIPYTIGNGQVIGVHVALPKTNLLAFSTEIGYIMCGALDVQLLNDKLSDRNIIAARAVGVRTLEQLLEAPMESCTFAAQEIGIVPGISGKEALQIMLDHTQQ